MSGQYRVALEGFGAFERQTLESFFKLTAGQQPSFDASASLTECDLCVVDSDRPAVVEEVRQAGRMDRTVFVGTEPPTGAIVHLGRPINARQVARGLETLLLALNGVADPYAPRPAPAARPRSSHSASPVAAGRARAPGAVQAANDASSPDRLAEAWPQFPIDVIVIEDSDTAAARLSLQLQQFGCRIDVAHTAEEAFAVLSRKHSRMVFCHASARDDGGLSLCQQIKAVRKGAPTVVVMSPQLSSSDRVRGQLAGADAMLLKPVSMPELLSVLQTSSNRRRRAR